MNGVQVEHLTVSVVACPVEVCRSTAGLFTVALHTTAGSSLLTYATCQTHGRQAWPLVPVSDPSTPAAPPVCEDTP